MTICFADLPEKPAWSAQDIVNVSDDKVKQYADVYRQVLLFSRAWLGGEQTFYLQTSGSTGVPKPVSISRKQMLASIRGTAIALQLQRGHSSLVCLHPDYIAGMMMLARGWEIGMNMYFVAPCSRPLRYFTPETGFDFLAMVPMQLQQSLENQPDRSVLDRCGKVIVGGAAVSAALERATQQTPAAVYATFGMTETVSHVALRRINGKHPETDYELLPDIEARTDERGCLMLCGEVTQNRWITANDIVTFTTPRRFRFEGRADFVINSGGVKIFPEQLEQKIAKLGLTFLEKKRFVVSSLPDMRLGERAVLAIESDRMPEPQHILRVLKNNLERYHAPQGIFFVPQFPETATGKIDRKKLQATLLAMQSRQA